MKTDYNTHTILIDGTRYTDIVHHDFKMNPEADELIYSDELADGMIVLRSENLYDITMASLYNAGLPVRNRWARVTKKRVSDGGSVYFTAVYRDGQKSIRASDPTQGWIVKKDSIPAKKPVSVTVSLSPSLIGCFIVMFLVVLAAGYGLLS